jgi:hypothetical protein
MYRQSTIIISHPPVCTDLPSADRVFLYGQGVNAMIGGADVNHTLVESR